MTPSPLRWRVISRAVLMSAIALIALGSARATDEEVLAKMQQRMIALKQQMAKTEDLAERATLQKQAVTIINETLKQLSPQSRPMVEVGLKLVQPLQTDAGEYMLAVNAFFSSEAGDFRSIKSREEIKDRIAKVDQLDRSNRKLLERINSLESDAEKMLETGGVSRANRAGFMEGLRQGAAKQMGAMRALRTLDSKMYDQWKAALSLLDAHFGKWHSEGDGPIVFDDEEAKTKFLEIVKEIETLGERSQAAEQAIFNAK